MIRITYDQRCRCTRPLYVRSYLRRPACLCGRFIVSTIERERLELDEAKELEDEHEFLGPSSNGTGGDA